MSFGKYSYGIYVLHAPIWLYQGKVLMMIAQRVPAYLHVPLWLCSKIVGVAMSYGAARVSWYLVEKRFLALKSRFAAKSAPQVSPQANPAPCSRCLEEAAQY